MGIKWVATLDCTETMLVVMKVPLLVKPSLLYLERLGSLSAGFG